MNRVLPAALARANEPLEVVDQLRACRLRLGPAESRAREIRCGAVIVADELHEQPVPTLAERVGHVHAGFPRLAEHVELVAGPTTGEQRLAVVGHAFGRALIARFRE